MKKHLSKELVLGYIDTVKVLCAQTEQKHAFGIYCLIEEITKNTKPDDEMALYLILNLIRDVTVQTEENYQLLITNRQPKSDIVKKLQYAILEVDSLAENKLTLEDIGGVTAMAVGRHIKENGGDIQQFIHGFKIGIDTLNGDNE